MKRFSFKNKFSKGQAVLVVLLVMSVLLTLGLSVVSRSVTDVKISQQSQESARAFWTAQAGLEKALLAQGDIPDETIDGVSYAVTKSEMGGVTDFVFPERIDKGESFVYWLVDHNADGSIGANFYSGDWLTIYWGNSGDTGTALIVSLTYKDAADHFQSQKFTYDPLVRTPATGFTPSSPGGNLAGADFAHSTGQIPIPEQTYFANIKMLFNTQSQILGVKTESSNFPGPVQGSCYESTATVAVSNIVRKLNECRTWPKTPEIFDYLLYSEGDIS